MPAQVTARNNTVTLPVVELFSSIQGEGMLVGLRQVFLRLWGCNIACDYCDTCHEELPERCLLENSPGRRDFVEVANPIPFERILTHLERWNRGWPEIHHSLSLTGGEPLMHPETLRAILPDLVTCLPVYLETNGLLPQALELVIDNVSMIGMDIKLPSATGCEIRWEAHLDFLRIGSRKDIFVKVVVTDTTEEWELQRACSIVAQVRKDIPFIIQPVTSRGGAVAVSPLKLLEFQEMASQTLTGVRVIPQTHRFMGQL